MSFFEFFFSGPGWGWRFLCLLIFLETLKAIVEVMFNAFIKMHTNAKMIENKPVEETEEEHTTQATKDDFR